MTESTINASLEHINSTDEQRASNKSFALPLTSLGLILCILGLVGNGIIFWFLCYKINRNQFTIYILNLAVADFTFLFGLIVLMIYMFCILKGLRNSYVSYYIASITEPLYNFGFNAGIYLLTLISLERCCAVLYPIWYQCQRPRYLSVYICILCWMLSGLVTGLETYVCTRGTNYLRPGSENCTNVYFFTSVLYIIIVSTLLLSSFILLLDIRKASKHCHPPKLYIVIIFSAAVFLISVVPARTLGLLLYFNILQSDRIMLIMFYITSLCSAINCSANPYIYIIVGRWGKRSLEEGQIRQSLETVFKEVTVG